MAVTALKDYKFAPKDTQDKFHGAQLLYVGWDQHLMFCAPFAFPLPPDMPFQALLDGVLPGAYSQHPDFAQVDWGKVEWLKSSQPWQPDFGKTLAENGLKHKDVIRFRTPGLNGIQGSAS